MRLANRWSTLLLSSALAPCAALALQATRPGVKPVRFGCDGDTVTTINIRSGPAAASGLADRGTAQAVSVLGLPHTNTRDAVIIAYLRLAPGRACTELDRRESERLLRAQPFIASATVRAIDDGPGRVRIQVDVVDELPFIAGLRVSRGTVSSLVLGSRNVGGHGITLEASGERGFAYRNGFGIRYEQYALLGAPAFIAVTAERRAVIGEHLAFEVSEPFLTDLQRRAFQAGAALESGYSSILRPVGDAASVFYRRTSYDVGWVTRVGRASGRGAVGLVGAAAIGEDVRSGEDLVVVSDTGLIAVPGKPFGTKYPDFSVTRLAVIGGLRAIQFTTVHGFDALTAAQDMGTGVQLGLIVAPAISTSGHSSDILISSDVYAGAGNASSFVAGRALVEARGYRDRHGWDAVVATARILWYGKPTESRTHLASVEWSTLQQSVYPLQLTLREPDAGLPGYGGSNLAGGNRIVARFEERQVVPSFSRRADLAFAGFVAAGKLWAGDVPFGRITPVEGSAGVSVLAAFPSGGRRTFRMDLAFPFDPVSAGTHAELRFTVSDRARMFWLEPRDVARARTGAVPVNLMKW